MQPTSSTGISKHSSCWLALIVVATMALQALADDAQTLPKGVARVRVKPIFSIIADRVETVTPWLAERILTNTRNGATISWLPWWKLMGRFAMSRFRRRDPFTDLVPGDT